MQGQHRRRRRLQEALVEGAAGFARCPASGRGGWLIVGLVLLVVRHLSGSTRVQKWGLGVGVPAASRVRMSVQPGSVVEVGGELGGLPCGSCVGAVVGLVDDYASPVDESYDIAGAARVTWRDRPGGDTKLLPAFIARSCQVAGRRGGRIGSSEGSRVWPVAWLGPAA